MFYIQSDSERKLPHQHSLYYLNNTQNDKNIKSRINTNRN